jgi:hypothetical protein
MLPALRAGLPLLPGRFVAQISAINRPYPRAIARLNNATIRVYPKQHVSMQPAGFLSQYAPPVVESNCRSIHSRKLCAHNGPLLDPTLYEIIHKRTS